MAVLRSRAGELHGCQSVCVRHAATVRPSTFDIPGSLITTSNISLRSRAAKNSLIPFCPPSAVTTVCPSDSRTSPSDWSMSGSSSTSRIRSGLRVCVVIAAGLIDWPTDTGKRSRTVGPRPGSLSISSPAQWRSVMPNSRASPTDRRRESEANGREQWFSQEEVARRTTDRHPADVSQQFFSAPSAAPIGRAYPLCLPDELGLKLHSSEALDPAVDVVVALDQSNALHLGAGLEGR
jgi:hypothetical protein